MNDFGLDLAIIGNGRTAALVDPLSRIVWWCYPRFDGDPIFSRLVAGGEEKTEVARALGADVVIDRNTQDFVEVVKEVTEGRGADVVYDPVGGDTYARSTKCIAFEGRILIIGFAGGQIQSAALNHALVKNYSIVGLHWGLYQSKNPQLIKDCHAQLTKMVADGAIRPLVSERLGLNEVPAGVQRLADGGTVGRVVFVP